MSEDTSHKRDDKPAASAAGGAAFAEDHKAVQQAPVDTSTFWKVGQIALATSMALTLFNVVAYAFNIRFISILENQYFAGLFTLLFPFVFIVFPGRKHVMRTTRAWIIDWSLYGIAVASGIFLFATGERNIQEGWEYTAADPNVGARFALIPAFIVWGLLLEALRRSSGWPLTIICGIFSFYPIIAGSAPGPFAGAPTTAEESAAYYFYSREAIFGIPMKAFGGLVIGFVLFGVGLRNTGAGSFFLNFAFALLGGVRGGAAKVAIFSSGLLGSMSGSVVTNVMTTGVMTIPAMRRTGFRPTYAAGVEACASTGGVLMPPVMGATAFVMASFLNIDYVDVALAAVAPSLLYYFGLFVQIDSYAAMNRLKGLPRAELPSIAQTFREGWHYLFAFALLIFMLLYLRREAQAPFYALAALIITNQIFGRDKWGWAQVRGFLLDAGRLLTELAAMLAGIGLIIGSLSVTGLSGTLATDLSLLAGNSVLALLFMTAAISFLLGMGMTVTAAYIFLAVLLAPALENVGLDALAVHMFVLYWGMLSFITPPVAIGAFSAASVAGAPPMRVAVASMRLGAIIYFVPFFFVFNPALIFNGGFVEVLFVFSKALVGVWIAGSGLQGYLSPYGRLPDAGVGLVGRIAVVLSGLLLAFPGAPSFDVGQTGSIVLGVVLLGVGLALAWPGRNQARDRAPISASS